MNLVDWYLILWYFILLCQMLILSRKNSILRGQFERTMLTFKITIKKEKWLVNMIFWLEVISIQRFGVVIYITFRIDSNRFFMRNRRSNEMFAIIILSTMNSMLSKTTIKLFVIVVVFGCWFRRTIFYRLVIFFFFLNIKNRYWWNQLK